MKDKMPKMLFLSPYIPYPKKNIKKSEKYKKDQTFLDQKIQNFTKSLESNSNNIMINNGFHPHVWFKNSGDVFKHNIVFTEHKDIRLQDWGKEVDYNLFPDEATLKQTQKKG